MDGAGDAGCRASLPHPLTPFPSSRLTRGAPGMLRLRGAGAGGCNAGTGVVAGVGPPRKRRGQEPTLQGTPHRGPTALHCPTKGLAQTCLWQSNAVGGGGGSAPHQVPPRVLLHRAPTVRAPPRGHYEWSNTGAPSQDAPTQSAHRTVLTLARKLLQTPLCVCPLLLAGFNFCTGSAVCRDPPHDSGPPKALTRGDHTCISAPPYHFTFATCDWSAYVPGL